jgi:hypothetical protein
MSISKRLRGAWSALLGRQGPPLDSIGEGPAKVDRERAPFFGSTIVVTFLMGVLVLGLFAWRSAAEAAPLAVFSVTVMLAVAATAIGALLGFLFGIPRSFQDSGPSAGSQTPEIEGRGLYSVKYQSRADL